MNAATLLGAVVAGAVGAAIPRKGPVKQRVGLALVAALTVLFVVGIWAPLPREEAGRTEWRHLLTLLLGAPIVGAIAILFIPRQALQTLRYFTYAVMGLTFVASLYLLSVPMTKGWHFEVVKEWIPAFGIHYHVAIDGISLWLVILTTFITPIAIFASFGSIKDRIKELCFAFLLLEGAMIGAFIALDLFLFYVFWELMLIPMYLMIGIWGGADKVKAAIKFFVYTMAGSVLLLVAMVYLAYTYNKMSGHWSFDYQSLIRVVLPKGARVFCFWAFSIAFFIKVPMWPVHTWLPDAHVQAPTGGSVILAAVMLKLGTYAYMRFSMVLFPEQATSYASNLAGVAILGGIVYAALVAWKQGDVKRLIAYSSVAHLGYIMLGLFGATQMGMQGAVLQMVNHGITTGALFMLVGVIYDRRHTRDVAEFGGIAKKMPVYATLFLIATFASVGVPGTNGFVGEFMVILATFDPTNTLGKFQGVHTVGAAFGVILAAVYMLSVVQKVFFGPLKNPKNKHLTDISPRESLAVAPLIVMIFVIGFFPGIFIERMKDSVQMSFMTVRDVSAYVISLGKGDNSTDYRPAWVPMKGFFPELVSGAPDYAEMAARESPPPVPAPASPPPAAPSAAPAPTVPATAAPTARPTPTGSAAPSGSARPSGSAAPSSSAAPSARPAASARPGNGAPR